MLTKQDLIPASQARILERTSLDQDLKSFRVNRNVREGSYRLHEIFAGLEEVETLAKWVGNHEQLNRIIEDTKVMITRGRPYIGVSDLYGALSVGLKYLRTGDERDLYLDAIHELVHIKQYMDGKELWDIKYSYVDRPTEIEAYRCAVEEARKIGMSDDAIANYLYTDRMTKKEHGRLLKNLNVASRQRGIVEKKRKTKSIRQEHFIPAKPIEVYEALVNAKKFTEFTGSKATSSPKRGSMFTALHGYVMGKFLKLQPGRMIVQEWKTIGRLGRWPDGYPPSTVEFSMRKKKNGTGLIMEQSDVPARQANWLQDLWIYYYWRPMKEHFQRQRRKPVQVEPKLLASYVGRYEFAPGLISTVTKDGDKLMFKISSMGVKVHLFPQSETKFFLKTARDQVSFVKDNEGEITQLILHCFGLHRSARKMNA